MRPYRAILGDVPFSGREIRAVGYLKLAKFSEAEIVATNSKLAKLDMRKPDLEQGIVWPSLLGLPPLNRSRSKEGLVRSR
jgi:hypothetical protein